MLLARAAMEAQGPPPAFSDFAQVPAENPWDAARPSEATAHARASQEVVALETQSAPTAADPPLDGRSGRARAGAFGAIGRGSSSGGYGA
eukprot:gnl/TRDRNA2_/TRDRNA2_29673_c0_seq1.p2 gnl/TRDRNA2_/TRDRNA2_29673_c0~~gnl/TRDRNA2_/TRDRNA2_29673_c0_seq1.p2  ORF type:complete len:101 (+),score=16.06 gnl/TRDRNA2_/TRDRNA2_29673_c0_seq1:36-305(+)